MSSRNVIIGWDVGQVGGYRWQITDIDPLLLRQAALYFDLIDYPVLKGRTYRVEPEVEELRSAGKLIRTEVPIPIGTAGEMFDHYLLGQVGALQLNNQDAPGQWSLAQPGTELLFPPSHRARPSLMMELHQAVPVPIEDVPIAEVMEFRTRRQDELLRYRGALDDVYQDIVRSGDIPHAKTRAVDRIQSTLVDIHRLMKESQLGRIQATVTVGFNLWDIAEKAAKGAVLAAAAGFPFEIGVLAGVGASAVRFDIRKSPKVAGIPAALADYAYLFYADTELRRSLSQEVRRPPHDVPTDDFQVVLHVMDLVMREMERRGARSKALPEGGQGV